MKKIILFILIFLLVKVAYSQEIEIKGTITDPDAMPVPGASILVKGTTTGTITDFDGNYTIKVPSRESILVFSFVGLQRKEVVVGNQLVINVKLENENVGIEEVIVTAMGVKRSDKSVGYSLTKVDAEKTQQKSEPDLLKSLQGKVAGVNIAGSSGAPGSATRITIRGNSSFLGNNQPLFVVDGIPYSNDQFNTSNQLTSGGSYSSGIATIDPNNIESITVLKGAAAAALYGSRASNGVILIKTKTGSSSKSEKKLEVSLSSSSIFEQISNLPEYQNTYGAGSNFIYSNANGSWGPRFDKLDSIALWDPYRTAFPDWNNKIPYKAYPNNVKELFKTGTIFENSLNLNFSTKSTSINATASMLNHNGFVPHSYFDKYSMSLGGNSKLTKSLTVGGNVNYTKSEQRGGLYGASLSLDPGQASSFASTLFLARNWDMSLPNSSPKDESSLFPIGRQADNPLWSWKNNGVTSKVERLMTEGDLSYTINDWITADYKIGLNSLKDNRSQVVNIGSRAYDGKGAITSDKISTQEIESNLTFTFTHKLTKDLNFRAVAGQNVNQRIIERTIFFGLGIVNPGVFDINNTGSVIPTEDFYSKRRLWGLYGDLTFEYQNNLFLNITGRNDWSSTLPVNHQSFFYPAFALSYVFTDGLKLKSKVLTHGKVRASWAKVANDADPYNLVNIYKANLGRSTGRIGSVEDNDLPFLGRQGMTEYDIAHDPNLSPEFTSEMEFGTQLEFFRSHINLDFTYYDKQTSDQIANVSLPSASGFQQIITNFGKMSNKGVEIGFGITPVSIENGLNWNIFTTFTKNKSKVIELMQGVERISIQNLVSGGVTPVLEPGQPYGILRGTKSARDEEGNLLVDPSTGLLFSAKEMGKIGDPNPDFNLTVTNTLKYKQFSFNMLWDYKKGGDIYSFTITNYLGRGVTKDTEDREKSWIIPGYYGDPNTGKPILDANGSKIQNSTQVSTNDLYFGHSFALGGDDEWSVYDATIFRLREISLTYTIPADFIKKLHIASASIDFTGRNLWYLAPNVPKYTHFDPEVNTFGASNVQGIDFVSAPSVKRYGINLKITF